MIKNWQTDELGSIALYLNGKAHESIISDNGNYVLINSKFISSDGSVKKYTSAALCPLLIGDVAMVLSDVPKGKAIGKCFIIDIENIYTLNQRIGLFRSKKINSKFLFYVLNRNKYFLTFDDGVNQTNLRKDDILSCPISFPDKHEQSRIVAVLETWDKAIDLLTRKIEIKKNVKKGLMQKILTGKFRILEFQDDWIWCSIGDLLKVKHGRNQSEVISDDGKYSILGTGGVIGQASQYLYDKPSVLIGRKGTIDKPRYIDTPFWTVDTLFYTEINNNNVPQFIYYKFLTINWKNYNEGSGVPSLSASTISSIQVYVPQNKNEQKAIAELLITADCEIEVLEKKLALLKDQKKFLLNKLITGEILAPADLLERGC